MRADDFSVLAGEADLLLESDVRYFGLGAAAQRCEDACLYVALGLVSVAAGWVAFLESDEAECVTSCLWHHDLFQAACRQGAQQVRLYVSPRHAQRCHALRAHGYESRTEVGFLANPEPSPPSDVRLHPVCDARDWQRKLAVHAESDVGADGYCDRPQNWTELMRQKWLAGGKMSYLIEYRGQIAGTVGTMTVGPLLRIKNLFVRPTRRRRGVGSQTVHMLRHMASESGYRRVGLFGVLGSQGARLYQKNGFRPATYQTEWTRKIA